MTAINQKEYLKKYLGIGKAPGEKKKKKKKEKIVENRLKIIDDDTDVLISREIEEDISAANEDAPQIVAVIDERPPSLRIDERTKSNLWKPIGEVNDTVSDTKTLKLSTTFKLNKQVKDRHAVQNDSRNIYKHKSDHEAESGSKAKIKKEVESSPERSNLIFDSSSLRRDEGDSSPPRRKNRKDITSPSGKQNKSSDSSPLRQTDTDNSPKRKKNDYFSTRRRDNNGDSSPQRKNKDDSDFSPPSDKDNSPPRKRNKETDSSSRRNRNDDYSPPRRRTRDDISPPRKRTRDESLEKRNKKDDFSNKRSYDTGVSSSKKKKPTDDKPKTSRWGEWSPEASPDRTEKSDKKMKTTLDGKKAGLQSAQDLSRETALLKQKEDQLFKNLPAELLGKNAATVVREKKVVDPEEEELKRKKEKETKEKYDRWGKGLKQVENHSEKMAEQLHEMSKPLARYADDEDLEKYLKEQEREGDPMLAYIRKKKRKQAVASGVSEKPVYRGEFMPNRFGICPGYRWDGVDRSNGYEKRWFQVQNSRRATQEEAFKWSTEDM